MNMTASTQRAHARETVELKTLTGKVILLDREDFGRLPHGYLAIANGYARIESWETGERKNIYLHRFILGLSKGDNLVVDHINGNRLDNRRDNLRTVSRSVNALNKKTPYSSGSTGLLGVSIDKRRGTNPFRAAIRIDGRYISLGHYATAEEAHAAYMQAKEPLISEVPDAIRRLIVEPGRISLHGVALTDGEYAVLRGIAERMKRAPEGKPLAELIIDAQLEQVEC